MPGKPQGRRHVLVRIDDLSPDGVKVINLLGHLRERRVQLETMETEAIRRGIQAGVPLRRMARALGLSDNALSERRNRRWQRARKGK